MRSSGLAVFADSIGISVNRSGGCADLGSERSSFPARATRVVFGAADSNAKRTHTHGREEEGFEEEGDQEEGDQEEGRQEEGGQEEGLEEEGWSEEGCAEDLDRDLDLDRHASSLSPASTPALSPGRSSRPGPGRGRIGP